MDKKELINRILEILAWGFIIFGVSVILLKALGVIHSPSELTLEKIIGAGILLELGRSRSEFGKISGRFTVLESKIDMIWSDFKKRKKI